MIGVTVPDSFMAPTRVTVASTSAAEPGGATSFVIVALERSHDAGAACAFGFDELQPAARTASTTTATSVADAAVVAVARRRWTSLNRRPAREPDPRRSHPPR